MSYNISTWKTKRIDGLIIPLECFFKRSFNYKISLTSDGLNIKGPSEGFVVHGIAIHPNVIVDKIQDSGDGSGWHHDNLIEMLKESKGELEAVLIWEGGDEITRIVVKDGTVEEYGVEL
jgi:hypothetical protein